MQKREIKPQHQMNQRKALNQTHQNDLDSSCGASGGFEVGCGVGPGVGSGVGASVGWWLGLALAIT